MADPPNSIPPTNELRRFRLRRDRVLLGLLAFEVMLLLADRRHWFVYRDNGWLTALLACGGVAALWIPGLIRRSVPIARRGWLGVLRFLRGRRWYQFSLRSLLVFTLIFAVTVGWLGSKIGQKRCERQAVEAILKAGGQVWFDRESRRDRPTIPNEASGPRWIRWALGDNFFSEVRQVGLCFDDDETLAQLEALRDIEFLTVADGGKITSAGVAHINALPHLRSLKLTATSVTDQWLDHLKGLPNLRILILDRTNIDDKSIGRITELIQLEELFLHTASVTDKGLKNFERMTRLRKLGFRKAAITGAGLTHLRGLTELEDLFLMDTNVDDAGLASLAGMSGLRRLCLSGTKVTDTGLANLRQMSRLESLDLALTQVTDAGLANLGDLKQLEDLRVSGTSVTADAVEELRKSLPKLGMFPLAIPTSGL
jgi:hypothetical protein